jgi:hypothetical protein
VRQANGEPAAAGAEISHDAAFANSELVHDLFRPLPGITIRPLEDAELLGREQTSMLRGSGQTADGSDDR